MERIVCNVCDKTFSSVTNRNRHQRTAHQETDKFICRVCARSFGRKDNLERHEKQHQNPGTFPCRFCDQAFSTTFSRNQHELEEHPVGERAPLRKHQCEFCNKSYVRKVDLAHHNKSCRSSYTCDTCGEVFQQMLHFNRHRAMAHQAVKRKSTTAVTVKPAKIPRPTPRIHDIDPEEFDKGLIEEESPEIVQVFKDNWGAIRTHHITDRAVQDLFNFRCAEVGAISDELPEIIFKEQQRKFKINLSVGFVPRHVETGELRYFHPSANNARALDEPSLISNENDFHQFLNDIKDLDFAEKASLRRPTTKWSVERLTNITFYVNKIADHPIGGAPQNMPDFIVNNPSIITLQRDNQLRAYYTDNLCLFRCLALWSDPGVAKIERKAEQYFRMFSAEAKDQFKGVTLSELPTIEELFQVNIMVYQLNSNQEDRRSEQPEEISATLIQRSLGRYNDTIYVNLYKNHFSFIKNMDDYSKSYKCRKCDKLWKNCWNLTRHEKTCKGEVTFDFAGGNFHPAKSIFEKLEEEGIVVPEEDRYFEYRATFDFESYFTKEELPQNTDKRTWKARHIPLSVSVCSNVPEFIEPKCFITTGCSKDLIRQMIDYLVEISHAARMKMTLKHNDAYEQLGDLIDGALNVEPGKSKHPLELLKEEFDRYNRELPVLGFNSSRYDINLVKRELVGYLVDSSSIDFNIKNGNSFLCISTPDLKFLDIMGFLAPGFSYDKYLKAYGASALKGQFPYEWVDSLAKLDVDHLPPHEAFFSELKGKNISDEDYGYCKQVWRSENMSTFCDFVEWYNNLDVVPFLEAVDKQFAFYKERHIDMFKDGVSVPGLTLKYMFSTVDEGTFFSLFNDRNSDLYHLLKKNIVGGPSIVFNRFQEAGITPIRQEDDSPKVCGGVVGFDANALYLWALSQDMPTGSYIRRRPENGFKPEKTNVYGRMAYEWLEFIAAKKGVKIQHQFNGREKQVGRRRLPVDGWSRGIVAGAGTVYQFHGCYHHGHGCTLTRDKNGQPIRVNKISNQSMEELYNKTVETSEYIRKTLRYNLVEIWECEWLKMKQSNPELRAFLGNLPKFDVHGRMTEEEALKQVVSGDLFGLIECDIHVPEELREHMSEMCPIFKNICISREDIGPHMKNYAEENKIMSTPRRSLIGSYKGDLLASPLLKWYLEHGLRVTKIYQIVQYEPKACFGKFADLVSDARREGDKDPDKVIVAETMKLIGNSGYGKVTLNKEKQRNVVYCRSEKVAKQLEDSSFRALNVLEDDLFEVERNKKRIRLNLPLHIGCFVYQLAKLKMLEFYYDFLDIYVDRKDYVCCQMDTDSSYIAISDADFENIIKPEKKLEFYANWHKWFPAEACDTHQKAFIDCRMSGEVWIPHACCVERKSFDKRKPGLFKKEYEGRGIVALCSKTYYCFGEKDKASCKGISKRYNEMTKDKYLQVLRSKESGSGVNRGFLMNNQEMMTYSQSRTGLTYFYPKRKVAADGITTTPLEI